MRISRCSRQHLENRILENQIWQNRRRNERYWLDNSDERLLMTFSWTSLRKTRSNDDTISWSIERFQYVIHICWTWMIHTENKQPRSKSIILMYHFQYHNPPIILHCASLLSNEFEILRLPIVRLLHLRQIHSNTRMELNILIFNKFCLLFVRICCHQPLSSFDTSSFFDDFTWLKSQKWTCRKDKNCWRPQKIEESLWNGQRGMHKSLISGRPEKNLKYFRLCDKWDLKWMKGLRT
jgi:hypothetical protein